MIEDFIGEIEKPQLAMELLLVFLQEYIYDNINADIERDGMQDTENLLAITYAINLVNEDLTSIKEEYKKRMIKEKYPKDFDKLYG